MSDENQTQTPTAIPAPTPAQVLHDRLIALAARVEASAPGAIADATLVFHGLLTLGEAIAGKLTPAAPAKPAAPAGS